MISLYDLLNVLRVVLQTAVTCIMWCHNSSYNIGMLDQ